ncbi:all trans-polyprenyl-diphosphate synthase PDSS1-like [Corticium candelabrum]|uniref:all trans-polyprenyl-diphosphate synthase PDSS1-like n=1 Tax=Corticium candelabrum TaxID=121492 RepID=UPI002E257194|nr:all trans-polyprenyl-diphosphate synthase PDSS1-like [Corticium candelabrum]
MRRLYNPFLYSERRFNLLTDCCTIVRRERKQTQLVKQSKRFFCISRRLGREDQLESRSLECDVNATVAARRLVSQELGVINERIQKELDRCRVGELREASGYYFNQKGKLFRPMVALLMSRACNNVQTISKEQQTIAMVTEMIHTATLVHDDVIDLATTRRSQPVANRLWGDRNAVLAGDFILAVSSVALSQVNNPLVVELMSQILDNLVKGEIMQLGTKSKSEERFMHYIDKTYKKTGSLLAHSCKSVAVLSQCDPLLCDVAFQYGRNLGIAFQLIDDMLDFISTSEVLGKPAAADLKLGLATAPVLFASEMYPELEPMIMRRFAHREDIDWALSRVRLSDGIQKTLVLAQQYGKAAVQSVKNLPESRERTALEDIVEDVLTRTN